MAQLFSLGHIHTTTLMIHFDFGDISQPGNLLGIVFMYASALAFAVAAILFVVMGFRVHFGWGLANLFIWPCMIAFVILYPKESKKPLIVFGFGLALFLCVFHFFGR